MQRGFADKETDRQMDICGCRVAFATENFDKLQNCGWDTESGVEPMFWTSIIFIPLFYILNFCLYFSHDERQAISNQTNPDGFHKYFTKATEMSPGVSIQGK